MIAEARDFLDESNTLARLLDASDEGVLSQETLFKAWTIEDIIAHLHMWNVAARLSLQSRDDFQEFFLPVGRAFMDGKSHIEVQRAWLDAQRDELHGDLLVAAWRRTFSELADAFKAADPEMRLAWAGPDMSARNAIIARQMETWAHGQAIFDALGREREDKDRIQNICHLGVTTYGWTFRNRGEEPPAPKPHVRLRGPSGAIWTWNDQQSDHLVEGDAVGFAQVVTQIRNIADTNLKTVGANAARWMEMAQCFAGPPVDPPAKGARRKA